ncbi:MAG: biosynthetic arginine decarboxylase [Verrucomicrobiae bacterium]|nr:biosynthetic arginine decarboxylase [Verrucomicrobiae bacterium]
MAEAKPPWDIERAVQTYNVDRWGSPYFSVNEAGHLTVSPLQDRGPRLDLMEVVERARGRGLDFPLLVRFQDLLRNRVETINEAFRNAIAESGFRGQYRGVFPIKVNQLREVVEEIVDAGAPWHFGLEAGSKPELAAALAVHSDPESLIVCNGYKDEAFVRMAILGRRVGKRVIIVVEKPEEAPLIVSVAREMGAEPLIGIRIKPKVKSAGKWALSSGESAKFGLSAGELVEVCDYLRSEGLGGALKMLHFHIGSQVPDIQIVKRAVREAARYYAKVRQMGFELEYFDVGGGLGIDYDGSRTISDASANYTLEEYCSDVVYNLMEVCDAEGVPHPSIVSESGRAIVSHHSVLLVEVFSSAEKTRRGRVLPSAEGSHELVADMLQMLESLSKRNRREVLHDAQEAREQAEAMFSLGLLDLRTKAQADDIYWHIAEKVVELFGGMRAVPEEIRDLRVALSDQYVCNFSVFQSLVDHWALRQLFPVMPIHRLDERPSNHGTLVDITCDSDGKISTFIDAEGVRPTLPLPHFEQRPFYLGFFLVGAYQDVMGDIHNLFGRVNEAHVFLDPEEQGGFYIEETIPGRAIAEVLGDVQYHAHELVSQVKSHVERAIKQGLLRPSEGMGLLEEYEQSLQKHTYLRL